MTFKSNLKYAVFLTLLFLISKISFAQIPVPLGGFLPGPTLPEQVSKAISAKPRVPTEPGPSMVPTPEAAPTAFAEQAKKIKFKLANIVLEGNHVYSDAQLRPLFAKQLNKTISIADLFGIVQAITNYYRNNGYIISRAILPPQHVKEGIVRVRIIEGYISKVEVTGKPRGAKCLVYAFGNQIKKCPPLKLDRMEKYMLLANEIPGTQVRAVLGPSKTETGGADLSLVTLNKPINGYFSYDDFGTRYIGPQQMTASLSFNSYIVSGDMGQITATKTPKGGELTYFDANQNSPIGNHGMHAQIGGTRSHTHPLFVLRPAQIDGLYDNYYTGIYFPLIRTRTKSLTTQVTFNYLDSRTTSFDELLYADHIRSLGIGTTYNFSDKYYGANLIYADIRQGLPILGYTSNTNPQTAFTSRPGGRGDYTKIDFIANRLQALVGPLSLYGQFRGQWAFNPLLASEQFTFGGSILGRGYDIAELIGDKGVAGSLELRYDKGIGKLLIQSLEFYTFYDAGIIWNFKFIGGVPRKQSGTATGVGVRFYMNKYVSGNFMWTQVLTKRIAAESLIGNGTRPRLYFNIVAQM